MRAVFDAPPQLDKLVDKQRETHRRMLEQLLMVEQAHKQALYKLEDEKRNHGEFMKKSDEFTNLLEQERERSVRQTNGRERGRRTSDTLAATARTCLRWPSLQRFGELQKFSFWFQGKVSMSHSLCVLNANLRCPSDALKQTGCTVRGVRED